MTILYNADQCWITIHTKNFKIKKVCPMRLFSRNKALLEVRQNYSLIMKPLYQPDSIFTKKDEPDECKNIILEN